MKESTTITYPYSLNVTIHKAENLAIADFTSSDPYVVLLLDEKDIGRTPTVYRSLNPSWEAKFVIPLTHIHSTLTFRIFDEDSGKNDDILGVVAVDLSTLYINELLEKSTPLRLRDDGDDLAKGRLGFSIFIERNDTLIKIEKNDTSSMAVSNEISAILKEEINNCLPQSTEDGRACADSSPIYSTMIKSPFLRADQDASLQVVNKGLLRDLMCDIRSLLRCQAAISVTKADLQYQSHESANSIDIVDDMIPMTLLRSHRPLMSSTCLNVDMGEYTSNPPISDASITLELKDGSCCTLIFPDKNNHYLLWVWIKWLKLVMTIQNDTLKILPVGEESKSFDIELPSWAAVGKLLSAITVVLKSSNGVEVRNLHSVHSK